MKKNYHLVLYTFLESETSVVQNCFTVCDFQRVGRHNLNEQERNGEYDDRIVEMKINANNMEEKCVSKLEHKTTM